LYIRSLKSQLLLALLCLGISNINANELKNALHLAQKNNLSQNYTWKSLLHLKDNQPQIIDPKFLLSANQFSLQAELTQTITLIIQDPKNAACRFPARLLFLERYINFGTAVEQAKSQCTEYLKFKDYVPFDELSLVFASEVLSSASSMMGHTFLKASGKNLNQTQVEHSIAFYTEFNTFNPFKLIYDGVFSGMEGFLMVRQYKDDLHRYVDTEGRNLWSYQLTFSDEDKATIQAHIWELKSIEISYLFQNYNCATLTLYLLSIASEDLRSSEKLYVSPVDVAKAVNEHNLVSAKEVLLATSWELRMLEQEMPPGLFNKIERFLFEGSPLNISQLNPQSKFLVKRFLRLILTKDSFISALKQGRSDDIKTTIAALGKSDLGFDISQYKNPINTSQDTIISGRYLNQNSQSMIEMTFLPASHYLYGNNQQYFAESELRIGELTLRANIDTAKVSLQSLALYAVRSYVPSSSIDPQLSGSFYLGYQHLFDQDLTEQGVFELSGSLGKAYQVHKDIMIYAMVGGGLALNEADQFAYIEPYVGSSIKLVGQSKLLAEYRASFGQFDISGAKETLSLDYAWLGSKQSTFKLGFQRVSNDAEHIDQVTLAWDFHF
jgi:hypothetical protein